MKFLAAKQITYISTLTLLIVCSTAMFSQKQTKAPQLMCRVQTSMDSVFFRDSIYVPTFFDVNVCVYNTGSDTAKDVVVSLVSNTRFIIEAPATKMITRTLLATDSICTTFRVQMTVRDVDGFDTLRSVVTTVNGGSAVCLKQLWVEHEYKPKLVLDCSIVEEPDWDDIKNDYDPNPFTVKVNVANSSSATGSNIGDDLDLSQLIFVLPKDLSPDSTNAPIINLGKLKPQQSSEINFKVHASKIGLDKVDTIIVQLQGIGGLHNKNFTVATSCTLLVPAAKQALYNTQCNFLPDSIRFINQRYTPDPFTYTMNVTNNGTANGQNVEAEILLPPSVGLGFNEKAIKSIGELWTGRSATVSWKLTPRQRNKIDTVAICARVYDKFGNQDICCDTVIIDSVKCGKFGVICTMPDTIRVDTLNGLYINNPFDVKFSALNIGSDVIDSVRATLIIEDPDVQILSNNNPILWTPGLAVGEKLDSLWICKALPRAQGATIRFRVKLESVRGGCTQTTECVSVIYIPSLAAPNLTLRCVPMDSVHFDPKTGGYTPAKVTFIIFAENKGGATAEEVCAQLLVPPGFILENDSTKHCLIPLNTPPNTASTTSWQLTPIRRTEQGLLATICAEVTAKNTSGGRICCDVFVPAIPYTAAIAITQDNVTYFGQEILVPVTIDNCTGKNIKDITFDVKYDPTVVHYQGTVTQGTMMQDWNPNSSPSTDGNIHVAASSTTPLSGAGTLVYLKFLAVFGGLPETQLSVDDCLLEFDSTKAPIFNKGSIFVRTTDGKITISGFCIRPTGASDKYIISQNKPNPFNPTTTIEFTIPEETHVRITVFDALGRTIETLVNAMKPQGTFTVTFDGNTHPSGMYYYKMETPKYTRIMKMILAR